MSLLAARHALLASPALPGGGVGDEAPSALDPQGPGASAIADLWWLMAILGAAVFLAVVAVLTVALRGRAQARPSDRAAMRLVVTGGIAIPSAIIAVLMAATLWGARDLRGPPGSVERLSDIPADDEGLVIEVVGHRFWWEARYPNGAVTANEIHVPAGRDVVMRMTTRDVIHSFWVPQLHGKVDMIPGETTAIRIRADRPGVFRGICAEFCGVQHARMFFLLVAEPEAEFASWLDGQAAPAREPTTVSQRRGLSIMLRGACAGCHTIAGTAARGELGPDLTHLASRRSIGAVTRRNDREELTRWVQNPQSVKPGSLMPPQPVAGEDLEAVVDYLLSLE